MGTYRCTILPPTPRTLAAAARWLEDKRKRAIRRAAAARAAERKAQLGWAREAEAPRGVL